MQAYVLNGVDDLQFKNVNMPELGRGEVLVRVMACGICGSDIMRGKTQDYVKIMIVK